MLCPNHTGTRKHAAAVLGYCGACLADNEDLVSNALAKHEQLRQSSGLVGKVAKNGKIVCAECGNHCRLNNGETGFCGLRYALDSKIVERFPGQAIVSWYFDPIPTNCTADWVCTVSRERKLHSRADMQNNLAVFYGSCNSDCLYCQNASHKELTVAGRPLMTPDMLANAADSKTACVCYFGGDPGCNAEHSLSTSELIRKEREIPICYETNGNISRKYLDRIAEIVLQSRGTLKFDLKAFNSSLYRALTGVSNEIVLRNFRYLARISRKREHEFLVASILLVPGYIGISQTKLLCEFIAECDVTIPTVLLGFYPHNRMQDLPRTSRSHALRCKNAAEESGLINVRIGNVHLLSNEQYNIE
jgi:pyruvate formate lyase activating enzyme